ncbi:MAG: hypothetical protein JO132_15380, partial [Streptosporangiaceae bacterium]|nr:hypothetical protein [Streptosporangiaceae bacterium]
MQRHRLREPITDDCPRCGWHGYFHHHITTIDGGWAAAVCGNGYADLHPDIAVTVRFYSVCSPDRDRPFGVIRQRIRSDYEYPDLGQVMYWRLWWEFTPALVEDARGE